MTDDFFLPGRGERGHISRSASAGAKAALDSFLKNLLSWPCRGARGEPVPGQCRLMSSMGESGMLFMWDGRVFCVEVFGPRHNEPVFLWDSAATSRVEDSVLPEKLLWISSMPDTTLAQRRLFAQKDDA